MSKFVAETTSEADRAHHVSPVFGDLIAKATLAIDVEVERRQRLGLPVIVDRGRGVEQLTG
ncbi:MAG: hypothetical protein ACRDZY_04810 [Acidimicrobiales bacterium]